jgi:hypothetical protein
LTFDDDGVIDLTGSPKRAKKRKSMGGKESERKRTSVAPPVVVAPVVENVEEKHLGLLADMFEDDD